MRELILSLLALLILASCSKNETIEQPYNGELRITSGIQTRASGTQWESGDAIGVYMIHAGTSGFGVIGKPNTQYSTTSNSTSAEFKVVSGEKDLCYPANGTVDILAYYPYSAAVYGRNYIDIDILNAPINLMVAKAKNLGLSKTAIDLKFEHILSKININMIAGDGLTADDIAEGKVKVTLVGVSSKATCYLERILRPSYDNQRIFEDYRNYMDPIPFKISGTNASAVVIPQRSIGHDYLVFEVADQGTFTMGLGNIVYLSGIQHNYNVTISRTKVIISTENKGTWIFQHNIEDKTSTITN